jgi:S-adenosyl methyltransferase
VPDRENLAAVNPTKPHIARVYDYLLGGTDNFAADRAVGDRLIASMPAVQVGVRAQRDVLGRVVRYLVGQAGIRQLLDIGSGLPTADNVHEIAQRIDPATRVVYLDNDPDVVSHAQAILAGNQVTFAAEGDLRDPAGILADPGVRSQLNWDQPIGLLLCGILHYILDEEKPVELVQAEMQRGLGRSRFRTFAEIREWFAGLELVEPAVVLVPDWRPGTPDVPHHPVLKLAAAGVARKPAP